MKFCLVYLSYDTPSIGSSVVPRFSHLNHAFVIFGSVHWCSSHVTQIVNHDTLSSNVSQVIRQEFFLYRSHDLKLQKSWLHVERMSTFQLCHEFVLKRIAC